MERAPAGACCHCGAALADILIREHGNLRLAKCESCGCIADEYWTKKPFLCSLTSFSIDRQPIGTSCATWESVFLIGIAEPCSRALQSPSQVAMPCTNNRCLHLCLHRDWLIQALSGLQPERRNPLLYRTLVILHGCSSPRSCNLYASPVAAQAAHAWQQKTAQAEDQHFITA